MPHAMHSSGMSICLKRARSVDQQGRTLVPEHCGKSAPLALQHERAGRRAEAPQLRREGRGPGRITAGEDELGVERAGEEPRDAGAEDAGPAEEQEAAVHPSNSRNRARTSGVGTMQDWWRPNSR